MMGLGTAEGAHAAGLSPERPACIHVSKKSLQELHSVLRSLVAYVHMWLWSVDKG